MSVKIALQTTSVKPKQYKKVAAWLNAAAAMSKHIKVDALYSMPTPYEDDEGKDLIVVIMEYTVKGKPETPIGDLKWDNAFIENLSGLWPEFPYWSMWKIATEPTISA